MKKILLLVVALSLFSLNAQALESKVGYVDFKRVIIESDLGKAAYGDLEKLIDEKTAVIDGKNTELKALEEELAKQASVLTPESLKKKQDEREKMIRTLQRMVKDSEDELKKKEMEIVQKISEKIRELLQKIGADEGYTSINDIFEAGVIYRNEEIDITEQVIKKFNEASASAAK